MSKGSYLYVLACSGVMIWTSTRHAGCSPRAMAWKRSRVATSGSMPRMRLASGPSKFWMPCSVLKWYLIQEYSPFALYHMYVWLL